MSDADRSKILDQIFSKDYEPNLDICWECGRPWKDAVLDRKTGVRECQSCGSTSGGL